MNKFKINEYITLKLENGKTNIYVTSELFGQYKYILTRRKINDIKSILELDSIDEIAEYLDHSLDGVEPK